MKPFESFMAQELEDYIMFRQNTGRDIKSTRSSLVTFDRYLTDANTESRWLEPLFFFELRERLKQSPRTVNAVLSGLRSFFKYLVRKGVYTQNPLKDVPPLPESYFIPFVFSPEHTDSLLEEACRMIRKAERYYVKDLAIYTAVVLLARCGLRISEPVNMKITHYRPEERTIYIEKTKFKKDRLIPVPTAAVAVLENYISVRNAILSDDYCEYLLADGRGNRLNGVGVRLFFHQAVKNIGLDCPKRFEKGMTFGNPIPHSLRHSFAINTLKRIKKSGGSPQQALPVLAAYMGHRKYKYTGAYLKVSDAKDVQGLIKFAAAHKHAR